jgi:hypothetical protein
MVVRVLRKIKYLVEVTELWKTVTWRGGWTRCAISSVIVLAWSGGNEMRLPWKCPSLALSADQVAHRRHIGSVTGEAEAAELPAILDGGKHRIVVIGHIGGLC